MVRNEKFTRLNGVKVYQEITSSVLFGDVMVQNRIFWNIGEHFYFFYYPIIFYQSIKVYRVETMDMGGFHWNNGVSGKCNRGNYYGTCCTR